MHNSLAKWKRDAEAYCKQDSTMFEGFLRTAEENFVRMFRPLGPSVIDWLSCIGKRR
jgi:hypothetical protein